MSVKLPFNRPCTLGPDAAYVREAIASGHLCGDGPFGKRAQALLEKRFGALHALLTTSCTAALEMAALLCDLSPGDEVILPSYTFVSTANAIALRGARTVFVDIRPDTLNLDERLIEAAITPRTRAIWPVHYAGVACEMDTIMSIARRHRLLVVEDAAQGVFASYKGRWLGTIGDLGCYSFHETKNYISGEGGALCINVPELVERAEIIRDKGTNRQKFFRGLVDKYTWVDIGSSYVPSEIVSAFLYGQLELIKPISERRREIYQVYRRGFKPLEADGIVQLPHIPEDCTSNYHMFYILTKDGETRNRLLDHLRERGIGAVFHYVPLHSSPMGIQLGTNDRELPVTDSVSARLLRLPFFYTITEEEQAQVIREVTDFLRRG